MLLKTSKDPFRKSAATRDGGHPDHDYKRPLLPRGIVAVEEAPFHITRAVWLGMATDQLWKWREGCYL